MPTRRLSTATTPSGGRGDPATVRLLPARRRPLLPTRATVMLRKLLVVLLGLVAGLVLLLSAAFAYAQSETGKAQIAGLIEQQASAPGRTVELDGLGGLLPFDIRLGRLRLADAQGPWLEVEEARVTLSAGALLTGKVRVETIGAERVALARLPEAGEPPPAEPFRVPELPPLPESVPAFALDRLAIPRLELGAPVLGQAATFAVTGHAGTDGDGKRLAAELAVERTDQPTATLRLQAGLDLADPSLDLTLWAEETGGLLAAVTGRPQAGALRATLEGKGPLRDWRGRLDVAAERLATLDLRLDLGLAELPRVTLDGKLATDEGALPAELLPLIGREATLALRLRPTSPERVSLEELRIATAGLRVDGAGSADLGADRLDGRVTLAVPDLAAAAPLAGTELAGAATVELTASGSPRRPSLNAALDVTGLKAADVTAARVGTRLTIAPQGAPGGDPPAFRVTGDGTAEGLGLAGAPLGPDPSLRWRLAGTATPGGPVELETLALEGAGLQARLDGRLDSVTLAGRGRLELAAPRLAEVLTALGPLVPAGLALDGGASLTADATLGAGGSPIEVAAQLTGEGLSGLPSGAAELLGAAPTLAAQLQLVPGQAVELRSLTLAGTAAQLDGQARLGLDETQPLAGTLRLELPKLAALADVLGRPIAGAAEAVLRLDGTLAAPGLDLAVGSPALDVAGRSLGGVELAATAAGPLATPRGRLRLAVGHGAARASLATDYALDDRTLTLDAVRLEAPATHLAGAVKLDLATGFASGRLEGSARDLGALEPWHGQKLAGSLSLAASAEADAGRQAATLRVEGRGIGGDFGNLRGLTLEAAVTDALRLAGISADLALEGFARPDLAVERAQVTAKGALADLRLTAEARGRRQDQPFDLASRAQLAAAEPVKRLELETLAGTLAGQRVALARPARITLGNGVLDIDEIDLQLADARLRAKANLGNGAVRGEVRLTDLALARLTAFGGPKLEGRGTATLTVSGAPEAPSLSLRAEVTQLRVPGGPPGLPPASASLEAQSERGRGLEATLRLTGLVDEPATARVALPLRLSLQPFAVELPEDARVDGQVRARARLERLAALAALDGQRVAGRLDVDLRLAGTLARPSLSGRAAIADGLVEDAFTGAMIRDLTLELAAEDRRIVVRRLAARDRRDGRYSGEGELSLARLDAPGWRVALRMDDTEVLRNLYGTATIAGQLAFEGDAEAAKLAGRIETRRVDLRLPEPSGAGLPTLAVVEVDRSGRRLPEPEAGGDAGLPVRLDLVVEMPGRVFVRGRGLDSEWGGRLTVQGTASEPLVVGEIRHRRGFLDFLDRRFGLSEGLIRFDGAQPPIPELAITASAKGTDIEAVVKVTGRADKPKIELTSVPTLPRDEVLSRLLFKRDTSSITPAQALKLANAVATLQGGGIDALGKLRNAIGLDTLDVGGQSEKDASARAGKYLSDNVYLEVERGLTPESGKARVEVELTPNLSASTEVSQTSQAGVRLQWKYDY